MTLSKIAKLANVSVSTVSKAFSESPEINEQTKNEIFKVAKDLGCFKKYYNAKYPKFVIAIICPEFKSGYYSSLISNIEEYLSEKNCEIIVAQTNFSNKKEEELLNYYNLYTSVDGIISIQSHTDLSQYDIPIVTMNTAVKSEPFIKCNFEKPILEALEYFKSKNVSDVGFIGEEKTNGKLEIFTECMNKIYEKVNENFISITEKRFEEGGYIAAKRLIDSGNIPRAVICAYDNMAIGAIRCFNEKNITVPNDIAVLGMDNIRQAPYLTPSLSSINPQPKKAYQTACEQMITILNGKTSPKNLTLDGELILRESTNIQ